MSCRGINKGVIFMEDVEIMFAEFQKEVDGE